MRHKRLKSHGDDAQKGGGAYENTSIKTETHKLS